MHDSFNPDVRQGILKANWAFNSFVHFIELDFVHGIFHERADIYKQMWGGFALALCLPDRRNGELIISRSQELAYEVIYDCSNHTI